MKLLLLASLLFIALPVLLLAGGLAANRPPLLDPPGAAQRLLVYLSTNVATTSSQSRFPELELPIFKTSPAELLSAVEQACLSLGWQLRAVDHDGYSLEAVVTTSLFRFQDDVSVRVTPHGERGSALHVRSASRLGKGDLAANTRHIQDLVERVHRVLRETE